VSGARPVAVGLEVGPRRRVFAQAIGWPGWCRSGRREEAAIEALAAYTGRYRAAMGSLAAGLGAIQPVMEVTERVEGDVTTDFGAPGKVLPSDRGQLVAGDPERLAAFLEASWGAFDSALAATPADDRPVKPLVGRSPDRMRLHVAEAASAYLRWLVRPVPRVSDADPGPGEAALRAAFRAAVLALPLGVGFEAERHPGAYAVRRECWHVLDHAWELEDRRSRA
jgi:hypothetical protein